jgi:hypothetical protein
MYIYDIHVYVIGQEKFTERKTTYVAFYVVRTIL